MPEQTFKSEPLNRVVTWRVSSEDENTDRWSTDVRIPTMKISVEVLVHNTEARNARLKIVDRAIRNLAERFDRNIELIVQWYAEHCQRGFPNHEPQHFERSLLKSATLFLDFTTKPTKRELLFWKTRLQHLGVPVSSHGNVPKKIAG